MSLWLVLLTLIRIIVALLYWVPTPCYTLDAHARHLPLGIQGGLKQHNPHPFCYKDKSSVSQVRQLRVSHIKWFVKAGNQILSGFKT